MHSTPEMNQRCGPEIWECFYQHSFKHQNTPEMDQSVQCLPHVLFEGHKKAQQNTKIHQCRIPAYNKSRLESKTT